MKMTRLVVLAAAFFMVAVSLLGQELVEGSFLVRFPNIALRSGGMEASINGLESRGAHVAHRLIVKPNEVVMRGVTPEMATELRASGAVLVQDVVLRLAGVAMSNAQDRHDQRELPLNGLYLPPSTGAGVVAVAMDGGGDIYHPEFAGRVLPESTNFADDQALGPVGVGDLTDSADHGNDVMSAFAGAEYGIASEADLLFLRVSRPSGPWYTDIVTAADYLISFKQTTGRRVVLNMSVAGYGDFSADTKIAEMVSAGITVVAAAGNDNTDMVPWPASNPLTIAVGATDENDVRAPFSNFGSDVDIFALGRFVDTAFGLSGGTSISSPVVAGIAALALSENPSITPAALRDIVLSNATPGVVVDAGAGSPNLLAYTVGKDEPVGPCVPDAHTLCLLDGRFAVRMGWEKVSQESQESGVAMATLQSDTPNDGWGVFYFNNPANPEVFIKLKNACGPFGHFWVFASGLTNLGISLTVTDTESGIIWEHESAPGQAFPSRQDTGTSFPCP